jgi:hypothetical protein
MRSPYRWRATRWSREALTRPRSPRAGALRFKLDSTSRGNIHPKPMMMSRTTQSETKGHCLARHEPILSPPRRMTDPSESPPTRAPLQRTPTPRGRRYLILAPPISRIASTDRPPHRTPHSI